MTWKLTRADIATLAHEIREGRSMEAAAQTVGTCARTVVRRRKTDPVLDKAVTEALDWARKARLAECKHGTANMYVHRGCRCNECKTFNTKRVGEGRLRRYSRANEVTEHGTSAYVNWGCRCEICTTAHHAKMKIDRESRKRRSDQIPHGTRSGYTAWACRCLSCYHAYVVRKKQIENPVLDRAMNWGKEWTGPELEIVMRTDMTTRQKALLLGRSVDAVTTQKQRLRVDPRKISVVGGEPLASRGAIPGFMPSQRRA